jgi:hypothetical protein
MSFLSRNPTYLRIVQLTAAQISTPTTEQLADYSTLYQLNVRPYTRYISNGTTLVLAGEGGTAGVDTITAQTMIDASITAIPSNATGALLKARANHTGTDPAGSVLVSFNGKTVEQCMVEIYAALAGAGPTAPQITTDPTISDTTPNVAQTLTVTPGTVTGGAHTETYFWSANGVPITALSTSTTYVVGAAYAGQVLSVTQRSTLNTGGLYSERTSAATSAVVGTVPTNSVAPTITPTGAQAVGTAYSVASLGTWANDTSATVEYQWLLNDAAITSATAATYTSILGQEGGTIKLQVRKTTVQGASIWYTSSNSSTVSGSATLTISTNPAFPATVTVGTAATVTNATWTGGTPTYVNTRIYVAEGSGGTITPYATLTANPAVYTPESAGNSFLLSATGLTTLVGKTVYCDQQWLFNGTTYTSPKSASKTVADVSATLAARTDTASMSFTQNTAITPVKPITGTGGTSPITYAISPALPSGLTMAISGASAGTISGTPTVTSAQATYTITVTDSVAASANATVTITVAAASVTALAYVSSPNYEYECPVDSSGNLKSTGYSSEQLSNGSSILPLSNYPTRTNGGNVRIGPTTQDSVPAILHRVISTDPLRNSGARAEVSFDDSKIANGSDYWFAFAYRLGSEWVQANSAGNNDRQSVMQVHDLGVAGNPMSLSWEGTNAGTYGNGEMTVRLCLEGVDLSGPIFRIPAKASAWMRVIMHYRPGVNAGQSPKIEMWTALNAGSYSQASPLISDTSPFGETQSSASGWAKIGIYKWTTGSWGSITNRTVHTSGLYKQTQSGSSLYNEAAAAIASYAIA